MSAATSSRSAAQPGAPDPSAPAVEIEQLIRRFGSVTALAGVSLSIRRGEFFSLLGPSGCGKTTLLRIIAGLDAPNGGRLRIGGREFLDQPAWLRPVNTVFQSYALFPHLNVGENIAFGLQMKQRPAPEVSRRVTAAMELAQVSELAARRPHELSGGQKQRVALARALVNEPQVLLLDEPLGALDLKLRRELQAELRRLQRQLGITFIHVTHDQDEALSMSDRVAVMNAGRIEQLGPPTEIYERPRNRFVASFIGACNVLVGKFVSRRGTELLVDTSFGRLRVQLPSDGSAGTAEIDAVHLAIRPECVVLGARAAKDNHLSGCVEEVMFTGAETRLSARVGNDLFHATELNSGQRAHPLRIGDVVQMHLPADRLALLED